MQQSDINYLYQLLSPWYDALFTLYGRETGLEFQRLVRMVAEGDSAITLDGKEKSLLNINNYQIFSHQGTGSPLIMSALNPLNLWK